jgi:hypothetical protein
MKKGTKDSRPMVRCPEEVIGTWNGYDIILKSNNGTEDARKFDKDVEEIKEFLSLVFKRKNGV